LGSCWVIGWMTKDFSMRKTDKVRQVSFHGVNAVLEEFRLDAGNFGEN